MNTKSKKVREEKFVRKPKKVNVFDQSKTQIARLADKDHMAHHTGILKTEWAITKAGMGAQRWLMEFRATLKDKPKA